MALGNSLGHLKIVKCVSFKKVGLFRFNSQVFDLHGFRQITNVSDSISSSVKRETLLRFRVIVEDEP